MTRIICDTMIWYYLSQNKIQMPDPAEYKLVCTHLSLTELAFTPNNFKNLEEIQNAIRNILSIESDFLLHYPYDHARSLIDPNWNREYNIEEDLVMAFIRVLLNHPKEGLIDNQFKKQLADISTKRVKNSTEWAEFLNKLYQPSKEISNILKRYPNKERDRDNFRKWFAFKLSQLSEETFTSEVIPWDKFELFEKVGTRYRRNMVMSKMKADRNDENDLDNMIYVQPGEKYWTAEKRWKSIINEVGLREYLYTQ